MCHPGLGMTHCFFIYRCEAYSKQYGHKQIVKNIKICYFCIPF